MKRSVLALVGLFLLANLLGWAVSAQPEVIEGFILFDLHLISQESLPHWTPQWTGPIQAATILAMLAELGHSELLHDFNGDGLIDELDTIALADDLGLGLMKTETEAGTNDARLVIGLARYVADRYPGEFVLKIYDEGFPTEFRAETGNPFEPGAIPGIVLQLMTEPTLNAYKVELESLEGVIVGLEEDPDDNNTYFSGRSLLFDETPGGYTPIDFAWAEEDRWEPGHQGKVHESIGWMSDRFLVEYRGAWTPVEFMLALSPWDRPDISDTPYPCPPDAVAYDVTRSPTPYGDVEVEECVERDDDVDTYTWTVTNIDFLIDGCGICMFAVPNPGLPILDHDEPPGVAFSPSPWAIRWFAHLGSCGILPGSSGIFSVSLPGPTLDVSVPGAVGGCIPPAPCALSMIKVAGIRTTGPAVLEDCPDLVAAIDDVSCVFRPVAGAASDLYELTVWAHVTNIGGTPVTIPTTVLLRGLGPFSGSMNDTPVPPLASGDSHAVILSFVVTADAPPCPLEFSVTPDAYDDVDECNEDNSIFGSTCCSGRPDGDIGACCLLTGACISVTEPECEEAGGTFQGVGMACETVVCPGTVRCPDLVLEILRADCSCSCSFGLTQRAVCTYVYSLAARVTNVGTAPSPSTTATLSPGGYTATVSPLNPGKHDDISFDFEVVGGQVCQALKTTLVVEINAVAGECNEDNNSAEQEVECP